jgi:hypothetical protein
MKARDVCIYLTVFLFLTGSCSDNDLPWDLHGKLIVDKGSRYISYEDGTPFLWLGCTSWGMTEWLSREEVDYYLDDRKSKGMNVVQLCLFFGKRTEAPLRFPLNAPNYYGYKAFEETDSLPDVSRPAIVKGGTPENPDDYWDHVDYCLNAIKKRGMYAAVLPFWGRRYVNASHPGHSTPLFTMENIFNYGEFLGKRYGKEPNIIWVNGGDVKADQGGDYLPHYRLLAEGLLRGATGSQAKWNEDSSLWDKLLMTYHPDGTPMINSSEWFHTDIWLDFNMIETHIHRNKLVAAIQQDINREPVKPTILAEGHYEGYTGKNKAEAIHIRRQAYQTFFAGAAGHTYGGADDNMGNGPLFSPSNNWKILLNWEGACQMKYLRIFLEENDWWRWEDASDLIQTGKGEGDLQKLCVRYRNKILVYFPDSSSCSIESETVKKLQWFNPVNGESITIDHDGNNNFTPPNGYIDGVLILK